MIAAPCRLATEYMGCSERMNVCLGSGEAGSDTVSHSTVPERRRLDRAQIRMRSSLIVERGELLERFPCMILDVSQNGLRIGGASRLSRGQMVEVVLDEHHVAVRYEVIWTGALGSVQQGEAGLRRTIRAVA